MEIIVRGVKDLVIAGSGGNELSTSQTFTVGREASAICAIQEFDDIGFSPLVGDSIEIAGFVTLGDIPAVPEGASAPARARRRSSSSAPTPWSSSSTASSTSSPASAPWGTSAAVSSRGC